MRKPQFCPSAGSAMMTTKRTSIMPPEFPDDVDGSIDTIVSHVSLDLLDYPFVENLTMIGSANGRYLGGNALDNVLTGSEGKNILASRDGDDTLIGNGGNDILFGSTGADTMSGGAGNDRFDFGQVTDSTAASRDVILDFTQSEDRLNFGYMDANANRSGNQAFALISGNFTGEAGQIRTYIEGDHTFVAADITGDGIADFLLELNTPLALTTADFIL